MKDNKLLIWIAMFIAAFVLIYAAYTLVNPAMGVAVTILVVGAVYYWMWRGKKVEHVEKTSEDLKADTEKLIAERNKLIEEAKVEQLRQEVGKMRKANSPTGKIIEGLVKVGEYMAGDNTTTEKQDTKVKVKPDTKIKKQKKEAEEDDGKPSFQIRNPFDADDSDGKKSSGGTDGLPSFNMPSMKMPEIKSPFGGDEEKPKKKKK